MPTVNLQSRFDENDLGLILHYYESKNITFKSKAALLTKIVSSFATLLRNSSDELKNRTTLQNLETFQNDTAFSSQDKQDTYLDEILKSISKNL